MLHSGRGARRRSADRARRSVDREVDAGRQDARGDESHHCDEGFSEHPTVANDSRVGFVGEELRSRSRGDQRVEAANRAAGDGDERERENLSREYGPRAIRELRQRRHL